MGWTWSTIRPMPPPSGREHGCVFVGAMDYRPNVDGVCWFAKEIWPTLQATLSRAEISDCRSKSCERSTPARARSLGLKSLAQCLMYGLILPMPQSWWCRLRIARGVQNKVLEAMAMGKAVVASPEACAGLRCRSDSDILTAGDPRSWIEVVTRCLESQDSRHVVGAAGRQYVEQFHSWKSSLDFFRVARLFDGLT